MFRPQPIGDSDAGDWLQLLKSQRRIGEAAIGDDK